MSNIDNSEISLRVATEKDAAQALEIYAPYVLDTAVTFEWEVPTLEEFQNRMMRTLQKYPFIVAEQHDLIVGYTYASPFRSRRAYDWAVESAIYVRKDCRRSGAGRKLYNALETVLKLQGILSINACIAYSNKEDERLTKDSFRFHERMGYSLAGEFHDCGYKFDTWYNVVWMEKTIGPHTDDVSQPLAFSRLSQAEIERALRS